MAQQALNPRLPDPHDHDCRCVCGSLVARVVNGVVELKCRRCKRTLVVELEIARPEPRLR